MMRFWDVLDISSPQKHWIFLSDSLEHGVGEPVKLSTIFMIRLCLNMDFFESTIDYVVYVYGLW